MTAKAHVIAYDDAGHPLGELATPWTGDNNAVAVVDSDGTIHAVSAGLVTLGTDILPHPSLTSLYVTPDDSCGDVTNVTDWAVEGGLAWALEADSTNSVGQAHHAMSWSFTAVEPRQVNTGEIVWSPAPPDPSQHFTVQVHDTVQVGDTVVADRVGSVVRLLGGVRLNFLSCELSAVMYPTLPDSSFLVRSAHPDSLLFGDFYGTALPFRTGTLIVAGISSSAPIALGGSLPILPPTDNTIDDVGYAPHGAAARLVRWSGSPASAALTFNATPSWDVPATAVRR